MTLSRYLPVRTRRALAEQEGCQACGDLDGPFQNDHTHALALGGDNGPGNLRKLCVICHGIKTVRDVRMIRKADRIRRKAEGTWIGKRSRPMRSRNFQKASKPLKSRGFQKNAERVDQNSLNRGSFAAKSLWRKDNDESTKWPKRKIQSRGWT